MGALAAVFASATAESRALREYDAAVRVPLPRCRRIGFVHLASGVGASTAAARVAAVLARHRTGMVLAVDASPSPRGLLPLLDAGPSGTRRPHPITAADARTGLSRAPGGCYGLDLRPARRGVPGEAWSAGVGPIARFFDVVVTDWGLRHPAYDLEPVLTSSHVVCLVVRTGDASAEILLRALETRPATPPVVVARVGTGRRPGPVVVIGPGAHLRLAAELMRPTEGDRRDR
jgi:hypothetical protein